MPAHSELVIQYDKSNVNSEQEDNYGDAPVAIIHTCASIVIS